MKKRYFQEVTKLLGKRKRNNVKCVAAKDSRVSVFDLSIFLKNITKTYRIYEYFL